jgi:hypothetical protein
MTHETMIAYRHSLTDETMRLNPAKVSNHYACLDLNEWPYKNIVPDDTAV